jgi:hypothetical protein
VSELAIRVLTEHDADEFVRVRLEALTREPLAFGRAPEDALPWPPETVAVRLRAAPEEAARRLYRALGFEVYGYEKHALKVGATYVDEEHMVLWLR